MNEKPEDLAKEEFDEKEFKPNPPPPGSEKDDGGVRLEDFVATCNRTITFTCQRAIFGRRRASTRGFIQFQS
jgi:hypothetical protein